MRKNIAIVYPYDPNHHVPGTVGNDEHRCASGYECKQKPDYSVLWISLFDGESWWTACRSHATGLKNSSETLIVWSSVPYGESQLEAELQLTTPQQ